LKLLLVDDHALFRSGLKLLLRELPGEIECFEAGNPADALAFADKAIDLILLDLSMPGSHGTSALERMREAFADVPIVVISSEDDPMLIRQVIDLGASGFVPKSSTHRILISALQLILAGGVYLPMHVLSQPARSAPAHERAIRTLMAWGIDVDEAMFLGGLSKSEFLREFEPDFFFDDQTGHCQSAASVAPTGHVVSGVSNKPKS
jgi:DNA-binding NarL/FixJ family response regulator